MVNVVTRLRNAISNLRRKIALAISMAVDSRDAKIPPPIYETQTMIYREPGIALKANDVKEDIRTNLAELNDINNDFLSVKQRIEAISTIDRSKITDKRETCSVIRAAISELENLKRKIAKLDPASIPNKEDMLNEADEAERILKEYLAQFEKPI